MDACPVWWERQFSTSEGSEIRKTDVKPNVALFDGRDRVYRQTMRSHMPFIADFAKSFTNGRPEDTECQLSRKYREITWDPRSLSCSFTCHLFRDDKSMILHNLLAMRTAAFSLLTKNRWGALILPPPAILQGSTEGDCIVNVTNGNACKCVYL